MEVLVLKLLVLFVGILCLVTHLHSREIQNLKAAAASISTATSNAAAVPRQLPALSTSTDKQQPLNHRLGPFLRMPKDVKEAMQMMVQARIQRGTKATFIQVGANDGKMFDPLYPSLEKLEQKKNWIGLQVEPQPQLYGALAVLHADAPDWAFYLGAVASPDYCINGRIKFCETKTPGEGDWTTQGQVNSVADACGAKTMHFQQRPCVTNFDDLIYQHASPAYLRHVMQENSNANGRNEPQRSYSVDLLQIDVEGRDYDVLQLIDWKQLRPACIQYEQMHLKENQKPAKDMLRQMGYTIQESTMDVLACQVQTS